MLTNTLSPSTATLNPDVVNILMVARDEMLSGAALRASATSASWAIVNSLSGGYFGVWAPAAALAKSKTRTNASFVISLSFPSSNGGRVPCSGQRVCRSAWVLDPGHQLRHFAAIHIFVVLHLTRRRQQ